VSGAAAFCGPAMGCSGVCYALAPETDWSSMSTQSEITRLLADWSNGDQAALDRLLPLVYEELHRLARSYMRRERPDHTLQTTALVHEAYLRLVGQQNVHWQSRVHFFAAAAQVMRHILVDHARGRRRVKRGEGTPEVSLDEGAIISEERADELLAVNDALISLTALDPRKSRVFELRYFGGMSVDEAAEALQVSPATVARDWRMAKAWLRREMVAG
jgi:RNA polymerase sigma-70 factor, ECF subfamily